MKPCLLPLDRGGRLRGDVPHNTVHALDRGGDLLGDLSHELERQFHDTRLDEL